MTRGTRKLVAAILPALLIPVLAPAACDGGGGGSGIAPSFTRDVAPVIAEERAGCHQAGGIAPFPLETADQVASRADHIGAALQAGLMPPWPPGGKSPAYVGERERTLGARERAMLVAGRTPVARSTALLRSPSRLRLLLRVWRATVRLRMPAADRPSAPEGGTDDYRCFFLDPSSPRMPPLRVLDRAGQPKVVHHVNPFRSIPRRSHRRRASTTLLGVEVGAASAIRASGSTRRTRSTTPTGKFGTGAWAARQVSSPHGTRLLLEAGSRIAMQVHYTSGTDARRIAPRSFSAPAPASA